MSFDSTFTPRAREEKKQIQENRFLLFDQHTCIHHSLVNEKLCAQSTRGERNTGSPREQFESSSTASSHYLIADGIDSHVNICFSIAMNCPACFIDTVQQLEHDRVPIGLRLCRTCIRVSDTKVIGMNHVTQKEKRNEVGLPTIGSSLFHFCHVFTSNMVL